MCWCIGTKSNCTWGLPYWHHIINIILLFSKIIGLLISLVSYRCRTKRNHYLAGKYENKYTVIFTITLAWVALFNSCSGTHASRHCHSWAISLHHAMTLNKAKRMLRPQVIQVHAAQSRADFVMHENTKVLRTLRCRHTRRRHLSDLLSRSTSVSPTLLCKIYTVLCCATCVSVCA